MPAPASLNAVSALEIPAEFAHLKETHEGTNGKLLIHIQDPHSNLSGQENLAQTLDSLMSRYGTELVLSEGGSGDCSLTKIKHIASDDIWQRVAKSYLMQGKMSGEEYLNLTTDHPMRIMGIEKDELYLDSLKNYAALAGPREKILAELDKVRANIGKLKNRIYPEELKSYEKGGRSKVEGGGEQNIKALIELAKNNKVSFEKYPELVRIDRLLEKEMSINFELANLEQSVMIEEIAKRGGKADLDAHLKRMDRLKGENAALFAYFQKTVNIAKANNLDISKYENLNKYGEYLREYSQLDLDKVLDEQATLEQQVYIKILETNNDGRMLAAIDRYVSLLFSAFRIQMTTDEFNSYTLNEPDFGTVSYEAFLNTKLTEFEYFDDVLPYDKILEEAKESLKAFYDSVSKRDFAFVENIDSTLKDSKEKTAFLITGGYHTAHLKKLLKEKGYSYAVVTPRVTSETIQSKYERLLLAPIQKEKKFVGVVDGKRNIEGEGLRLALLMSPLGGARLSEMQESVGGSSGISPRSDEQVDSLLRRVKKKNYWIRTNAMLDLGKLREKAAKAVPAIQAALNDPNFNVRRIAAFALADIGPAASAALEPLKRLLSNDIDRVRQAAQLAIDRITGTIPDAAAVYQKTVTYAREDLERLFTPSTFYDPRVSRLGFLVARADPVLLEAASAALKASGLDSRFAPQLAFILKTGFFNDTFQNSIDAFMQYQDGLKAGGESGPLEAALSVQVDDDMVRLRLVSNGISPKKSETTSEKRAIRDKGGKRLGGQGIGLKMWSAVGEPWIPGSILLKPEDRKTKLGDKNGAVVDLILPKAGLRHFIERNRSEAQGARLASRSQRKTARRAEREALENQVRNRRRMRWAAAGLLTLTAAGSGLYLVLREKAESLHDWFVTVSAEAKRKSNESFIDPRQIGKSVFHKYENGADSIYMFSEYHHDPKSKELLLNFFESEIDLDKIDPNEWLFIIESLEERRTDLHSQNSGDPGEIAIVLAEKAGIPVVDAVPNFAQWRVMKRIAELAGAKGEYTADQVYGFFNFILAEPLLTEGGLTSLLDPRLLPFLTQHAQFYIDGLRKDPSAPVLDAEIMARESMRYAAMRVEYRRTHKEGLPEMHSRMIEFGNQALRDITPGVVREALKKYPGRKRFVVIAGQNHEMPIVNALKDRGARLAGSSIAPADPVMADLVREKIGPAIQPGSRVLEIGTGSGVLTRALAESAKGIPDARFIATDMDPSAVVEATRALAAYPNVEVRQGDLFAPLRADEKFDVIFWNPPWFAGKSEGKLFGQAWSDYRYGSLRRFLNAAAKQHLTANGRLYVIFPKELSNVLTVAAEKNGWSMLDIGSYETAARTVVLYEFRSGAQPDKKIVRPDAPDTNLLGARLGQSEGRPGASDKVTAEGPRQNEGGQATRTLSAARLASSRSASIAMGRLWVTAMLRDFQDHGTRHRQLMEFTNVLLADMFPGSKQITYDFAAALADDQRLDHIGQVLRRLKRERFLEIGPGQDAHIGRALIDVLGFDRRKIFAIDAHDWFKPKPDDNGGRFVKGRIETPPVKWAKHGFDRIYAAYVFSTVSDSYTRTGEREFEPAAAAKSVRALLRPAGTLMLNLATYESITTLEMEIGRYKSARGPFGGGAQYFFFRKRAARKSAVIKKGARPLDRLGARLAWNRPLDPVTIPESASDERRAWQSRLEDLDREFGAKWKNAGSASQYWSEHAQAFEDYLLTRFGSLDLPENSAVYNTVLTPTAARAFVNFLNVVDQLPAGTVAASLKKLASGDIQRTVLQSESRLETAGLSIFTVDDLWSDPSFSLEEKLAATVSAVSYNHHQEEWAGLVSTLLSLAESISADDRREIADTLLQMRAKHRRAVRRVLMHQYPYARAFRLLHGSRRADFYPDTRFTLKEPTFFTPYEETARSFAGPEGKVISADIPIERIESFDVDDAEQPEVVAAPGDYEKNAPDMRGGGARLAENRPLMIRRLAKLVSAALGSGASDLQSVLIMDPKHIQQDPHERGSEELTQDFAGNAEFFERALESRISDAELDKLDMKLRTLGIDLSADGFETAEGYDALVRQFRLHMDKSAMFGSLVSETVGGRSDLQNYVGSVHWTLLSWPEIIAFQRLHGTDEEYVSRRRRTHERAAEALFAGTLADPSVNALLLRYPHLAGIVHKDFYYYLWKWPSFLNGIELAGTAVAVWPRIQTKVFEELKRIVGGYLYRQEQAEPADMMESIRQIFAGDGSFQAAQQAQADAVEQMLPRIMDLLLSLLTGLKADFLVSYPKWLAAKARHDRQLELGERAWEVTKVLNTALQAPAPSAEAIENGAGALIELLTKEKEAPFLSLPGSMLSALGGAFEYLYLNGHDDKLTALARRLPALFSSIRTATNDPEDGDQARKTLTHLSEVLKVVGAAFVRRVPGETAQRGEKIKILSALLEQWSDIRIEENESGQALSVRTPFGTVSERLSARDTPSEEAIAEFRRALFVLRGEREGDELIQKAARPADGARPLGETLGARLAKMSDADRSHRRYQRLTVLLPVLGVSGFAFLLYTAFYALYGADAAKDLIVRTSPVFAAAMVMGWYLMKLPPNRHVLRTGGDNILSVSNKFIEMRRLPDAIEIIYRPSDDREERWVYDSPAKLIAILREFGIRAAGVKGKPAEIDIRSGGVIFNVVFSDMHSIAGVIRTLIEDKENGARLAVKAPSRAAMLRVIRSENAHLVENVEPGDPAFGLLLTPFGGQQPRYLDRLEENRPLSESERKFWLAAANDGVTVSVSNIPPPINKVLKRPKSAQRVVVTKYGADANAALLEESLHLLEPRSGTDSPEAASARENVNALMQLLFHDPDKQKPYRAGYPKWSLGEARALRKEYLADGVDPERDIPKVIARLTEDIRSGKKLIINRQYFSVKYLFLRELIARFNAASSSDEVSETTLERALLDYLDAFQKDNGFGRHTPLFVGARLAAAPRGLESLWEKPAAKVILADFDNTAALTTAAPAAEHPVSDRTRGLIRDFVAAGGEFSILSTRAAEHIRQRLGIPDVRIYGRFGAQELEALSAQRFRGRHLSIHELEAVLKPLAVSMGLLDPSAELQPLTERAGRNPDMDAYRLGDFELRVTTPRSGPQVFATVSMYPIVSGGTDPRERMITELRKSFPGLEAAIGGRATINLSLVNKADLVAHRYLNRLDLEPGQILVVDDEGTENGTGFKMLNLASAGVTSVLVGKAEPSLDPRVIISDKQGPDGLNRILEIEIAKRRLEKLKAALDIGSPALQQLSDDMLEAMRQAGAQPKGPFWMLPSGILAAGQSRDGRYVAVELGGTKLRAGIVAVAGGQPSLVSMVSYPIPDALKSAPVNDLFDWVAGVIRRIDPQGLPVGFAFTFPIRRDPGGAMRLVEWRKGFSAEGIEGRHIGEMLGQALERAGAKGPSVAVANDAVAVAALSGDIGFVHGTGANAAVKDPATGEFVDVTLGNFDRFPDGTLTAIDDRINDTFGYPPADVPKRRFSKMVAGRHLGELARLALEEVFGRPVLKPRAIETRMLAAPASIPGLLPDEAFAARVLSEPVQQRSASVFAAAVVATVRFVDPALSRAHVIPVDGSVYRSQPGYAARVDRALGELLGDRSDRVRLAAVENASLLGAALIAAKIGRGAQPLGGLGARLAQDLRDMSREDVESLVKTIRDELLASPEAFNPQTLSTAILYVLHHYVPKSTDLFEGTWHDPRAEVVVRQLFRGRTSERATRTLMFLVYRSLVIDAGTERQRESRNFLHRLEERVAAEPDEEALSKLSADELSRAHERLIVIQDQAEREIKEHQPKEPNEETRLLIAHVREVIRDKTDAVVAELHRRQRSGTPPDTNLSGARLAVTSDGVYERFLDDPYVYGGLLFVGASKPLGFLTMKVLGESVDSFKIWADEKGLRWRVSADKLYVYDAAAVSRILDSFGELLVSKGVPTDPSGFIDLMASRWINDKALERVIAYLFADRRYMHEQAWGSLGLGNNAAFDQNLTMDDFDRVRTLDASVQRYLRLPEPERASQTFGHVRFYSDIVWLVRAHRLSRAEAVWLMKRADEFRTGRATHPEALSGSLGKPMPGTLTPEDLGFDPKNEFVELDWGAGVPIKRMLPPDGARLAEPSAVDALVEVLGLDKSRLISEREVGDVRERIVELPAGHFLRTEIASNAVVNYRAIYRRGTDRLLALIPDIRSTQTADYLDLTPYQVPLAMLRNVFAYPDAVWNEQLTRYQKDQDALQGYLSNVLSPVIQKRLSQYFNDRTIEYIWVESDKAAMDLASFSLERLIDHIQRSRRMGRSANPGIHTLVYPLYPSVYSPAEHRSSDYGLTEELSDQLSKAPIANGDRVLDAATGSGYLTWLSWRTLRSRGIEPTFYAFDINPFAVANARALAAIAGYTVDVRRADSLYDDRNVPLFADAERNALTFRVIVSNNPAFPKWDRSKDEPRLRQPRRFDEYWDSGAPGFWYGNMITRALPRILAPEGLALLWNAHEDADEDRFGSMLLKTGLHVDLSAIKIDGVSVYIVKHPAGARLALRRGNDNVVALLRADHSPEQGPSADGPRRGARLAAIRPEQIENFPTHELIHGLLRAAQSVITRYAPQSIELSPNIPPSAYQWALFSPHLPPDDETAGWEMGIYQAELATRDDLLPALERVVNSGSYLEYSATAWAVLAPFIQRMEYDLFRQAKTSRTIKPLTRLLNVMSAIIEWDRSAGAYTQTLHQLLEDRDALTQPQYSDPAAAAARQHLMDLKMDPSFFERHIAYRLRVSAEDDSEYEGMLEQLLNEIDRIFVEKGATYDEELGMIELSRTFPFLRKESYADDEPGAANGARLSEVFSVKLPAFAGSIADIPSGFVPMMIGESAVLAPAPPAGARLAAKITPTTGGNQQNKSDAAKRFADSFKRSHGLAFTAKADPRVTGGESVHLLVVHDDRRPEGERALLRGSQNAVRAMFGAGAEFTEIDRTAATVQILSAVARIRRADPEKRIVVIGAFDPKLVAVTAKSQVGLLTWESDAEPGALYPFTSIFAGAMITQKVARYADLSDSERSGLQTLFNGKFDENVFNAVRQVRDSAYNYARIAIPKLAKLPVDRIMEGARLALSSLASAA